MTRRREPGLDTAGFRPEDGPPTETAKLIADLPAIEALLPWTHLPDAIVPRRPRRGPARRNSAPAPWAWSVALADPANVLFLDVETTGLSRYYDVLTMVGYRIGGHHHVFVVGDDPEHLMATLAGASTLVTFNGTVFDIPFLRVAFPGIKLPQAHLDLRFVARRAGLAGGQKAIERELGLDVRGGLDDVDGAVAVLLWHRYVRGDRTSLRSLIDYNAADVSGMCGILDEVCRRIAPPDLLSEAVSFAGLDTVYRGLAERHATLPDPGRVRRVTPTFDDLFGSEPAGRATIVGIDLTGSEGRPSGVCVLRGAEASTRMVGTDDELVAAVVEARPDVVSIDSPLSLPRGRTKVTDDDPERAEYGIMRVCERELKRRGINVYPCLLPSMQRLTARGIDLAGRLRALGYPVIESYPGAAQDIMGIPRKGAGEHLLKAGLAEFGIGGAFVTEAVRHDELDAITSALVGTFFLAGRFEGLTGPGENALVIPDLRDLPAGPVVVGLSGRIGAGKTTVARLVEARGFRYARFSQIVDEVIRADGLEPDRRSRQEYGWRIHVEKGQAWLLERLLADVPDDRPLVIDGLRFPEDHANLVERFGKRFTHVHIECDAAIRARRHGMDASDVKWLDSERASTELHVEALSGLAHLAFGNEGSFADLDDAVTRLLARASIGKSSCQSPS